MVTHEPPITDQIRSVIDNARSRRSSVLWTPGSDPLEAVLGWLVEHVRALRHVTHSQLKHTVQAVVAALIEEAAEISDDCFDAAFSTLPPPGESWFFPKRDIRPRQAALLLLVELACELVAVRRLDPSWFQAVVRRFLDLDDRLAALPSDMYSVRIACLTRLASACRRDAPGLWLEAAHRAASAVRMQGGVLDSGAALEGLEAAIEASMDCAADVRASALEELAINKMESGLLGLEARCRLPARLLLSAARLRLTMGDAEKATHDAILIREIFARSAHVRDLDLSEERSEASALLRQLPDSTRVRTLTRAPQARRLSHARFVDRTDLELATVVGGYDPAGLSIEHAHQATSVEATLLFAEAVKTSDDAPWEALVLYRGACDHLDAMVSFRRGHVSLRGDARQIWEDALVGGLRAHMGPDVVVGAVDTLGRAAATLRCRHEPSRESEMASALRLLEATASILSVLAHARIALDAEQWRQLQVILDRPVVPLCSARLVERLSNAEAILFFVTDAEIDLGVLVAHVEQRTALLLRQAQLPGLSRTERLLLSNWANKLVDALLERADKLIDIPPVQALAVLDSGGALAHRVEVALRAALPSRIGRLRRAWRSSQPRVGPGDGRRSDAVDGLHWYENHLDEWSRWEVLFDRADLSSEARDLLEDRTESQFQFVWNGPVDEAQVIALLGELPAHRDRVGEMTRFTLRPHDHLQASRLAAHARTYLQSSFAEAAREGLLDERCTTTSTTPDRLNEWFASHPHDAIVAAPAPMGLVRPLMVFTWDADKGEICRCDVGTEPKTADDFEPHEAWLRHYDAIARDSRDCNGASAHALGVALDRLRRSIEPRARQLAEVLERAGTRRLLLLTRQPDFIWAPWESAEIGEGVTLGERFPIVWLSTLSELPRAKSVPRSGTLQLIGEGGGDTLMKLGSSAFSALSGALPGTHTISGEEAADGDRLSIAVEPAQRLRIFAHGHLDLANPESNRLTLVWAAEPEERLNLRPSDLRRLPLAGMDCVELWACTSSGHGRHMTEVGMTDEPEDLASAFFVAGARHVIGSRWPVPGWPTALLMERYALLVTSGRSEVDAMAQARAELRRAFARDGVIHEEVRRGAKQRLVADARPMTDIMVDEVLRALLDEAVQRLRSSWYAELHISVPKPLSPIEGGFESMVRWLPPAPERRRAALDGPKVEGWVDEVLTRFRNPSCWAGWRVVARSLGDLA